MQNRRDFIKRSCSLCLGFVGMELLTTQLSSCASLPIYKTEITNNLILVPLSSFTNESNMIIVRNNKMEYDILVVKLPNGNYNALYMKCTHQDNPLTANKSGLFCSAHSSTFDLEGNVTKEPALLPLKKFKTEINNSSVQIII